MEKDLWNKLDGRLRTVGALVRPGVLLADVGTDHGYLIAHLALCGHIQGGVACDIHPKPLEKARALIRELGIECISTRCCDGLTDVAPQEADDIAIAGMGGELIARIVDNATWLRDKTKHLILQPQTRPEELRRYLWRAGFEIESERAVQVGRFTYTVLSAYYGAAPREPGELECYAGRLPESAGGDAAQYLLRQAHRLRVTGAGWKNSKGNRRKGNEYYELANRLETLAHRTYARNGRKESQARIERKDAQ